MNRSSYRLVESGRTLDGKKRESSYRLVESGRTLDFVSSRLLEIFGRWVRDFTFVTAR